MPGPHRRHRFLLHLEADTLEELLARLQEVVDDIGADGNDSRRLSYHGHSSTYQGTLRTDPEQDAHRYREQLAGWHRNHCVDWP